MTTGEAIIVNSFKFGVCCTLLSHSQRCEREKLSGGGEVKKTARERVRRCNESGGKRCKENERRRKKEQRGFYWSLFID